MVGNLVNASSFGTKAWHHAYYVGTALHIYNTLIQLGAINSTDFPMVERLCLIFEEAVFMGQRASRNLLTSFQRWSGGCISFPKGRCRGMHSHSHSNDTGKKWSLKYVRDVSQGGNDLKRSFNPMKISIFSLLSSADFVLDDDILAWAYSSKPWQKASGSHSSACLALMIGRPRLRIYNGYELKGTPNPSSHDPWKPFETKSLTNFEGTFQSR